MNVARTSVPRENWVDVSRGIGILLVVYGHLLRGNFVTRRPDWAAAQDAIIYAFHMPLFFVLSGLFLWSSLGREGFLASRGRQMAYPYLLWSLVTVALEMVFSHYVNSPVSVRDLVLIPFIPLEQYWFLYSLLVCQLVAFIAYPRKLALVFSAILGACIVRFIDGEWIVIRSLLYLPFVVFGVIIKPTLSRLANAQGGLTILVAVMAWSMFGGLCVAGQQDQRLFLGALGSIGTIALAMLVRDSTVLAALGRASLAIYLLHTILSRGRD